MTTAVAEREPKQPEADELAVFRVDLAASLQHVLFQLLPRFLELEAEAAEKRRQEDAAAAEKRKAEEAALAAERARLEEVRRQQEAEAAKLREEQRQIELEKARQEAAERARVEMEARLKREAEEKAAREKEAQEAAEQERLKADAELPQREKFLAIADAVDAIVVPEGPGSDAVCLELEEAANRIRKIANGPLKLSRDNLARVGWHGRETEGTYIPDSASRQKLGSE